MRALHGSEDRINVDELEVNVDESHKKSNIRDIFRKDARKRTLLACFLMGTRSSCPHSNIQIFFSFVF